jgi:hypothetical protein
MPALVLVDGEPEIVALLLEAGLRTARRNAGLVHAEMRQLAAAVVGAAPLTAVRLPALLAAAGPEVATAVKAQATGTGGSTAGADTAGLAGSRRVSLTAATAACIAGVSSRAVRAACASGRLVARKSRITGEWRVSPDALGEWTGKRNGA